MCNIGPIAEIDGAGIPLDEAIERSQACGQIEENKRKFEDERDTSLLAATKYGTSSKAKPLSYIIEEMIVLGINHQLILKSQIIWPDSVTLCGALNEACINLGLSDEDYAPYTIDDGDGIDLVLA